MTSVGAPPPLLRLSGVKVCTRDGATVLDAVDLDLRRGEIVCLVGESGSGKTTTGLNCFGYRSHGLVLEAGDVLVEGIPIRGEAQFRHIRGRKVAYVPQNPATALNPSMRVMDAIADTMRERPRGGAEEAAVLEILGMVGLPQTMAFARRFPHELSGGQQQRVCIAAALAARPDVLILDEPTTGLDVVTQARILVELLRLRDQEHIAMLYITHDFAVSAQIADRIVVMYGGYIVEDGPASNVLCRPFHPYTRGLMASIPDHLVTRHLEVMPGGPLDIADRRLGCPFAPRCTQKVDLCETDLPILVQVSPAHTTRCTQWRRTEVIDWSGQRASTETHTAPVLLDVVNVTAEHRSRRGDNVVAARGISFRLRHGACLALVGESGSGKTTVARVIAGLHPNWSGELLLDGERLARIASKRSREQRRRMQIVFQNPTDALNPRHSVAQALTWPARILCKMSKADAAKQVRDLLDAVQIPASYAERYPHELSGGQLQRVAIARALAADPDAILCDEITSALDVSVQARILKLLVDLRRERGISLLFITHDLGVVAAVADEVLVLDRGIICEEGNTEQILAHPQKGYTQELLRSAPSLVEAIGRWNTAEHGGVPAAAHAGAATGERISQSHTKGTVVT